MKFGISTACLYPMQLEDAFGFIADSGVQGAEVFINTFSELSRPFILGMAERARENGVEIFSLHPFTCPLEPMMLFTEYERRVDDFIELYRRFFDAMHLLGAEILVLHGNKTVNPCPRERYFERYRRLFLAGREEGITVAQENVKRCNSRSVEFCRDMAKNLGNDCAFVLDIKQAVRAREDPFDFVRALGDRIVHLHLSDNGAAGDCLPIGRGSFDFPAFFKLLRKKGFDGSAVIELYRSNYSDKSELLDSYNRLISLSN